MARGEIDSPDVSLETDSATLLSLIQSDRPVDDPLATGHLRLSGDREVVDRFLESVSSGGH